MMMKVKAYMKLTGQIRQLEKELEHYYFLQFTLEQGIHQRVYPTIGAQMAMQANAIEIQMLEAKLSELMDRRFDLIEAGQSLTF